MEPWWREAGRVDPRRSRDPAIHDHEEAVSLKNTLESNTVKLAVKAGNEGRLFGSVKPADVADAVKAAGLGELDKRKIQITSSIKSGRRARGDRSPA